MKEHGTIEELTNGKRRKNTRSKSSTRILVVALVVVAVPSMQPDNAEIHATKDLAAAKETMHAVVVQEACVGHAQDLEYATFLVDGLTKKRSSTFNMSGLTGSTNGHFGGVASSRPVTWRRQQEQEQEQGQQ